MGQRHSEDSLEKMEAEIGGMQEQAQKCLRPSEDWKREGEFCSRDLGRSMALPIP